MTNELSTSKLMQLFPNDIVAETWFEDIRWPKRKNCPKCGHTDIQEVYNRCPQPLRCRKCKYFFSVRKDTAMEYTNIGLQKWIFVIYIIVTSQNSVIRNNIRIELGLSLKNMRNIKQRLCKKIVNENNELIDPYEFCDKLNLDTIEKMEMLFCETIRKQNNKENKMKVFPVKCTRFQIGSENNVITIFAREKGVTGVHVLNQSNPNFTLFSSFSEVESLIMKLYEYTLNSSVNGREYDRIVHALRSIN